MYNAYQYQNYQPPFYQRQPQPHRYEIIRVHGRDGINALAMPENSSVLCLDETDSIVWLAQTDGAGFKSVTPFRISKIEAPQSASESEKHSAQLNSLETRITRLERLINGESDNAGVAEKRSD
jgi:hypothetical protein